MATRGKSIPRPHALALIALVALVVLNGCVALRGRKAIDPLTPAEHLDLGASYERAGMADLALREYGRAAVGPTRAMALTCQGNVHSSERRWTEAESSFRQALAVDPDYPAALNNLAWLLCEQRRSLPEAERLVRHAIERGAEPRALYLDTLNAILAARK